MNEHFLKTELDELTALNNQANASFLISFFLPTHKFFNSIFRQHTKHTFIFLPPTKPTQKKMKECFLQRFFRFVVKPSSQFHYFAE
jgi:hypothetical protein